MVTTGGLLLDCSRWVACVEWFGVCVDCVGLVLRGVFWVGCCFGFCCLLVACCLI